MGILLGVHVKLKQLTRQRQPNTTDQEMFSKGALRLTSGLRHHAVSSSSLLRPLNRCFSADTQSILQLQEVLNLRETMKNDSRKAISFTEFENLCAEHGIEDPAKLASNFHQAGVALNLKAGDQNTIFLDPEAALETMLGSLSYEAQTKEEHANRLATEHAAVLSELVPFEERQQQMELRAHRAGRRVVWSSALGVTGFMAASAHLTWWVVSWDIMEPVTYHIGLCVVLAGSVYAAVLPKEEFCMTSLADVFSNRRRRIDTAAASLSTASTSILTLVALIFETKKIDFNHDFNR